MQKLAIVLVIAIIAASFYDSVLGSLKIECDDACEETLRPMIDLIRTQQDRLKACERSDTNAEQTRIDGQLEDLHKKLEKFTSVYETIGSRFFYIEKRNKLNWFGAANFCRQKGGYLVNIRDAEELSQISTRLDEDSEFWLDINDLSNPGEYISSTTGEDATFFDWHADEPQSVEKTQRCVSLRNGKMKVNSCGYKNYFICQADGEN